MVVLTYLTGFQDWKRRLTLYFDYTIFFSVVWALVMVSSFKVALTFLLLGGALAKDVLVDMIFLKKGGSPALYDWVEHNPLNITFMLWVFTGVLEYQGSFQSVEIETLAVLLAFVDFVVDGGQDIGVEWKKLG
jgi:hypothetical protein